MSTTVPTALAAALLGLATLAGCGDGQGSAPPVGPGKADLLVGTWKATGQEAASGDPVEVRMDLRPDGTLRVVVTDAGGASLVFPGSWLVTDDGRLRLQGAWFRPDGQVTVRCRIDGAELILQDDAGSVEIWARVT